MRFSQAVYDVGKSPKDGTYRSNARMSGLAHLKCKGGWEDAILPPARLRKFLKVRGVGEGQSLQVRASKTGALKPLPDGCYLYGVSPKGALYIDHRGAYGTHATMMGFRPVQAAGWVAIANHRVVSIDNLSGHYLPTEEQFLQTVVDLQVAGLVGFDAALLGWDDNPRNLSWLLGVEDFSPGAMHTLDRTDTPERVIHLPKTTLGALQLVPYGAALVCKNLFGIVTGRGRAPGWWLRRSLGALGAAKDHALYRREADGRPTRPWSPEPLFVQNTSLHV